MIDTTKGLTKSQPIIFKLYRYAVDFLQPTKPQNRNYITFSDIHRHVRLEFRKSVFHGKVIGFHHLEIIISAHHLFNDHLHNANDFSPSDCVETLKNVFQKLKFSPEELKEIKVVNIEFGINIILTSPIESIINGIIYTKKTPFILNAAEYDKISASTNYKLIKAYAKGLQEKIRKLGFDRNTFRFEVKSKEHEKIKGWKIYTFQDLLIEKKYNLFFQTIIDEWDYVLMINDLKHDNYNTKDFWEALKNPDVGRDIFADEKEKFYKSLEKKENQHWLIKVQIIDKMVQLSNPQIGLVKNSCLEQMK